MDNFVVECSVNTSWAFTVKKLGHDVTTSDYAAVIELYRKFGFVDSHYYERDSVGKFHVHGIVQLRKGFLRKRLCLPGFHTKLVELYDRRGWELYILRDQYLFDPAFEPQPLASPC